MASGDGPRGLSSKFIVQEDAFETLQGSHTLLAQGGTPVSAERSASFHGQMRKPAPPTYSPRFLRSSSPNLSRERGAASPRHPRSPYSSDRPDLEPASLRLSRPLYPAAVSHPNQESSRMSPWESNPGPLVPGGRSLPSIPLHNQPLTPSPALPSSTSFHSDSPNLAERRRAASPVPAQRRRSASPVPAARPWSPGRPSSPTLPGSPRDFRSGSPDRRQLVEDPELSRMNSTEQLPGLRGNSQEYLPRPRPIMTGPLSRKADSPTRRSSLWSPSSPPRQSVMPTTIPSPQSSISSNERGSEDVHSKHAGNFRSKPGHSVSMPAMKRHSPSMAALARKAHGGSSTLVLAFQSDPDSPGLDSSATEDKKPKIPRWEDEVAGLRKSPSLRGNALFRGTKAAFDDIPDSAEALQAQQSTSPQPRSPLPPSVPSSGRPVFDPVVLKEIADNSWKGDLTKEQRRYLHGLVEPREPNSVAVAFYTFLIEAKELMEYYSQLICLTYKANQHAIRVMFFNIAIVILGIVSVYLLQTYGNDQGIALCVENYLLALGNLIVERVSANLFSAVEAVTYTAGFFNRGDVDMGINMTFVAEYRDSSNTNDWMMCPLAPDDSIISLVYFGTELGYLLGCGRSGIFEKVTPLCTSQRLHRLDNYHFRGTQADTIANVNYESTCLSLGAPVFARREKKALCNVDEATELMLQYCEELGDKYFACGDHYANEDGYCWNEEQVVCYECSPFDPRERPWYLDSLAFGEGLSWAEPYVSFNDGEVILTAMYRIIANNQTIITAADMLTGRLSTLLHDLPAGDPTEREFFFFAYDDSNPVFNGQLISSDSTVVGDYLQSGISFNVIESTLTDPNGRVLEWEMPTLMNNAMEIVTRDWFGHSYPEPYYSTAGSMKKSQADEDDLVVFMASVKDVSGFSGVVVLAFPETTFFSFDTTGETTLLLCVASFCVPMLYTALASVWPRLNKKMKRWQLNRILRLAQGADFATLLASAGNLMGVSQTVPVEAASRRRSSTGDKVETRKAITSASGGGHGRKSGSGAESVDESLWSATNGDASHDENDIGDDRSCASKETKQTELGDVLGSRKNSRPQSVHSLQSPHSPSNKPTSPSNQANPHANGTSRSHGGVVSHPASPQILSGKKASPVLNGNAKGHANGMHLADSNGQAKSGAHLPAAPALNGGSQTLYRKKSNGDKPTVDHAAFGPAGDVVARRKAKAQDLPMMGLTTFLTMMFAFVVMEYYFVAQHGVDVVEDLTYNLTSVVSARVTWALTDLLEQPGQINIVNNKTLDQHAPVNEGSSRTDPLVAFSDGYLLDQVLLYHHSLTPVDMIFYALSDGYMKAAQIHHGGEYSTINEVAAGESCLVQYLAHGSTRSSEVVATDCSYNIRAEPWFVDAFEDGVEESSTAIYKVQDGSDGITYFLRFNDASGVGVGVFGVTILIDSVNVLISEYNQFQETLAFFVIEAYGSANGGALLAASDGVVYKDVFDQRVRLPAEEHENDIISMVGEYFRYDYETLGYIHWEDADILGFGDSRVTIDREVLVVSGDLQLEVVIAFPVIYFFGEVEEWQDVSLTAVFGVALMAICVAGISRYWLISVTQKPKKVKEADKKVEGDVMLSELSRMRERIRRKLGKLPHPVSCMTGKYFLLSHESLKRELRPGDSIRVGGYHCVVATSHSRPITHRKIPLEDAYQGPTAKNVAVYLSKDTRAETDSVKAKRFIEDAHAGRNVLDLIDFERQGLNFHRIVFYVRSYLAYNIVIRVAILGQLFLGFYEAPSDEGGEISDAQRKRLMLFDLLCIVVSLVDVAVEIVINGISYTDGEKTHIRRRNAFRIVLVVTTFLDWFIRRHTQYTTGSDELTVYLPYSAVLRPFILITQSDSLSVTCQGFFRTLARARDVFVVLIAFLVVSVAIGLPMFEGRYPANYSHYGRGFDDFLSALLTMFIFITTGENYPDVVYPPSEDNAFFKFYFFAFCFLGMLLLVSLIIAIFQKQYSEHMRGVAGSRRRQLWEGMVAAFILLDKNDSCVLESEEYADFFQQECCTGADFTALKNVDLNIKYFVEITEELVSMFDSTREKWHAPLVRASKRLWEAIDDLWCPSGVTSILKLLLTGNPVFPEYVEATNSSLVRSISQVLVIVYIWCLCVSTYFNAKSMGSIFFIMLFCQVGELFFRVLVYGFVGYWFTEDRSAGPRFEKVCRRVDFLTVAVALISFSIESLNTGSGAFPESNVARALISLPALRLFSVFLGARYLVFGIMFVLPGMASLVVLLLAVLYIFAALGCICFAGMFDYLPLRVYQNPSANFNSLEASATTLLQLMGGESWSDTMYAAVDATGQLNYSLFFIVYIIVITLLFVNLFIGVVCDAYNLTVDQNKIQESARESALYRIAQKVENVKQAAAIAGFEKVGGAVTWDEWNLRETKWVRRINAMKRRLFFETAKTVEAKLDETMDIEFVDLYTQAMDKDIPIEEWAKFIEDMLAIHDSDTD
eukprot:Rmarinus@m.11636